MRHQELHPRTAIINKSQKNKSRKARLDALAWLAEEFPQAFNNTATIHPLKTGIMEDILVHAEKAMAQGISKSKLREAVVLFTRRVDYLACLKAREMRIDLAGNPVEQVSEEDAEKAAQKIRKRVEKSVKNARKLFPPKSPMQTAASSLRSFHSDARLTTPDRNEDVVLPVYPARAPYAAAGVQTRAQDVVVKHKKTTRVFDPNAVARLKEKLGISRKLEEQTEVV